MGKVRNIYEETERLHIEKYYRDSIEEYVHLGEDLIRVLSKLQVDIIKDLEQTNKTGRYFGTRFLEKAEKIREINKHILNTGEKDRYTELKKESSEMDRILEGKTKVNYREEDVRDGYSFRISVLRIISISISNLLTKIPERYPYTIDSEYREEVEFCIQFYFYLRMYQSKLKRSCFKSIEEYGKIVKV